eukprot:snap_masked-scaffold_42-processed-gene-2.22-mRNA-1 protein AED:1.00 eAED:1.00 QI:0/0/0/0/1/1/2/0/74
MTVKCFDLIHLFSDQIESEFGSEDCSFTLREDLLYWDLQFPNPNFGAGPVETDLNIFFLNEAFIQKLIRTIDPF